MSLFRFEHKDAPLASGAAFVGRIILHLLAALALIGLTLAAGMAGYHMFEHLSLLDAFLNSAMLVGGMGPVNLPVTPEGKLFAGLYALVAGLLLVLTTGLILAPVLHRVLHALHVDDDGN